ncbi:SUMF1/EgtB/PvdO family nonheme iron enzyme [Devosia sp.]|uniref:SUMF1/EgtB/PvdO family nonheme iron enzyme n=1 Tax=Devosia sp. TaxID=1871048 RepID=UPI003BAC281A
MPLATSAIRPLDLLLPALLLGGLVALLGVQTGIWQALQPTSPELAPAVTTIPAHAYSYRLTGDFLRDGIPVDGPLVSETPAHPLDIMTYPVSAADYARCVAFAACLAAEPRRHSKGNVPVTGVNFGDATAYATWLSAQTGQTWRLPTVAEWTFAAGSKASDPALTRSTDATNPADRWLALYEKEAALGANALAAPQPLGSFGTNEFGVADLAGTVWEWTTTCGSRTSFDAAGATVGHLDSCGVRYLEGRHRTAVSGFIRDALAGGCSSGTPPDNLGFRLVRDWPWYRSLAYLWNPNA